ncbi:MAG: DUF6600 domain-containing protein [Limisphaerales bacterium]
MKNPLKRSVVCWLAAMAVLAGGCAEPKGTSAEAASPAPDGVGVAATAAGDPASQAGSSTNASVTAGANGTAVADPAPAPTLRSGRAPRQFPEPVTRVIELVEAGAGEEVVRAYVANSATPYELTLEDILYLRDIGIPDGVVAGMMRRGSELRDQQAEVELLQTNLVAAVEEIKAAVAGRDGNGSVEPGQPGDVTEGASQELAGPAPLPQPSASVPADAPAEVQPFYENLSPYGSWYQVPSYGWVWQPAVVTVNSGWMPYSQGGRWVWSDWGWYWSSEYSWGWAPFHYGRWATYPGLGWCWVPGTVWGPSWVTWRNHGSYVGWAPLPPACGWVSGVGLTWYGSSVSVGFGFGLAPSCYTFVSYGNFCRRNVAHHAIRPSHAETVYNNSTVVNNVINGNNNTIINEGVGYQTVATKSRAEIPKARIEPLPDSVDRTVRVDRMERSKDGLVLYRPTPVSESGGRPTALRAEARPSPSASAASAASAAPSRNLSSIPSRPGYDSRFGATPSAKPVESRGSGRTQPYGSVNYPNAASSRPSALPASRAPSVTRSPAPTRYGSTIPKATESRGTPAPSRQAPSSYSAGTVTAPSSPGTVLGPTRQTTPVPLADPTRYLPRSATPAPRGASPSPATKPGSESRGGVYAPTAPVAPTAPTYSRQQSIPRMSAPQASAAPKVNYSRPSIPNNYNYAPAPSRAPMAAPSRVPYSAPMPASRPSFSAPSPSFGAPSSARPSYSAPAPAMRAPVAPSAPRSSVGSSAPATSRPSAVGRSSGGRSQPN